MIGQTYAVLFLDLLPLLFPHFNEQRQALIVCFSSLKRIQSFQQDLSYAWVTTRPEQLLHRVCELLVHVPRESWARVVGENAHDHDGVVLVRRLRPVVLFQILPDEARAFGSGLRRRLGSVNDWRKVENLVARVVGPARFAKGFLLGCQNLVPSQAEYPKRAKYRARFRMTYHTARGRDFRGVAVFVGRCGASGTCGCTNG